MASAALRQELSCSICLSIYTDPVTLRCGHNFCRGCISRELDTQEESGVYSCPECRKEYRKRPALEKNRTLCNIVEHVRSIPEEGTGVLYTYGVQSPVQCSVHKKVLEYYCTEDSACICVSCCLIGEHRGHKMLSLDEASEKKKEKLSDVLQKLTIKRAETEKKVQNLQECRRDQGKAAGVTETVTALFRDIRRQLDDLEKRVLTEISRQKPHISLSVSDLIQQLEIKKDELSGKMRHIEELCNMSDPVTVLQEPDTGDLCDTEDTERHDNQVHGAGDLDVGLISGTLHTLSDIITGINTGIYVQEDTDLLLDVATAGDTDSDIITGINTGIYVQEATDLILDETTAGDNIQISGDRKTASRSDINQNLPVTPERFQYPQIISTRGFSSGRHYWEVDVSKSVGWRVGMCYPSIGRRGWQAVIGCNNKSWCLCRCNNQYSVIHDSREIRLPENIPYGRVRVYLDYEAGQLSFYFICDPIRHLHTYAAALTEPLHAALWVGHGCITISEGVSSWEKLP
ncbi:E3 ubiquitin-protein ligase TRIM39-like [Pseudophryne corroboree]|uniref:E3 ubiquitin-protein ligase TRIM39-like n=1 Tax=Pseudophryne corroboree TaxID=495146 RepID=UPI003081ADEF